jgi:hypothetical protein
LGRPEGDGRIRRNLDAGQVRKPLQVTRLQSLLAGTVWSSDGVLLLKVRREAGNGYLPPGREDVGHSLVTARGVRIPEVLDPEVTASRVEVGVMDKRRDQQALECAVDESDGWRHWTPRRASN